ncbi:hypothetical protein GCM10010421_36920 [Streptomyces glaucus]|uniref:Secreted protein n=1 Tax=Streptomyces glaucus TaxID=284029 RepID=A0ABN3JXU2_9ACTN
MPPSIGATSTQLPSALLCRLLIQQASSELARTPFCTGGTAVSLQFVIPAVRRCEKPAVGGGAGPSRGTVDSQPTFAQFLVQLHASAVSVDNNCGVNPCVGAPS